MARKTDKIIVKDFTKNIHSTRRSGTCLSGMDNWNEKEAKKKDMLACKDCRSFSLSCGEYIGRYYGDTEEEAISEFRSELSWVRKSGIDIGFTSRQLLNNLIVVEVK